MFGINGINFHTKIDINCVYLACSTTVVNYMAIKIIK